ncbi:MAG: hypothetical protein LBU27_08310 [Candidatus Peribacteria bacterium]|jgi:uncharacterized membrane protein|nr:hypothetical protein [Candidatus Peribacteria bacterium]
MKTKFWSSILTFLLLIQPVFLFAQNTQSTSDTDICAAPGETMLLYQRFQQEMASALLGGVLGEHIFNAEFSVMGLFTSKVLHLPTTNNSVLDTIRQTLWNNSRRLGTATVTTTVLLALAGVSVGVSNIEGFAILFQNRAIVRDYKSLLQIETKLNQIAYFLGKRTNLIAKLDNTGDGGALQKIVEKYVEEGLFTGNVRNDQTTYVGILTSLMRMNAGVKQFLSFRSTLLLNKLGNFYGTTFSETALSNLRSEYAGARFIDSCNTMGKRAFARIGNAGKAVGSSFKQAETTILKAAAIRFSNAFLEGSSRAEIVKRPGVAEKYFDDDELQQLRTIYGVDTSKMTETTAKGRRRIITPTTSTKKVLKDIGEKTVSLVESSIKAGTNAIASTKEYIDYLKENYKQHG